VILEDVRIAEGANYHQTPGNARVHSDLQRIAGKGIPEPV